MKPLRKQAGNENFGIGFLFGGDPFSALLAIALVGALLFFAGRGVVAFLEPSRTEVAFEDAAHNAKVNYYGSAANSVAPSTKDLQWIQCAAPAATEQSCRYTSFDGNRAQSHATKVLVAPGAQAFAFKWQLVDYGYDFEGIVVDKTTPFPGTEATEAYLTRVLKASPL